jgi:hypothetical protein
MIIHAPSESLSTSFTRNNTTIDEPKLESKSYITKLLFILQARAGCPAPKILAKEKYESAVSAP